MRRSSPHAVLSLLICVALCCAWPASVTAAPDAGLPDAGLPDAGASNEGGAPASQPAVKVVRIHDLLLRAIALYQRSEFAKARDQLKEVLSFVGDERSRAAQEAYTYLALVHLAFGDTEAAVTAFERALAVNSELSLPSRAPKILAALAQARLRYKAKVRAMDHDPPTLRHTPPTQGKYGHALALVVTATDSSGVKRVVLHHRQAGNRGFSSVNLERRKDGALEATVPGMSVARPGVEYYLEAWDTLGNGPGLKGSPAKPILVPVEDGPARAGVAPRPLYKKWWFWVAVGGAVAVTGGVIAASVMTRQQTARADVTVK